MSSFLCHNSGCLFTRLNHHGNIKPGDLRSEVQFEISLNALCNILSPPINMIFTLICTNQNNIHVSKIKSMGQF